LLRVALRSTATRRIPAPRTRRSRLVRAALLGRPYANLISSTEDANEAARHRLVDKIVPLYEQHFRSSTGIPGPSFWPWSAIQSVKGVNCLNSLAFILHDKARHPVVNNLWDGAATPSDYRVPQAMASITTNPNGSGQSIGKRRAAASPRNATLASSSTSPMNSTCLSSRNGRMCSLKYRLSERGNFAAIRSGRPTVRAIRMAASGTFLGGDPAQESEIFVGGLGWR
jgi:hypothetical protein